MAFDQRATASADAFAERTAVDLLLERPWWFELARCRGFGTSSFVPSRDDGKAIDRAKVVCARCCVRRDCFDYALDDADLVGVWGGTTERERRALRRAGKRRAS